MKFRVLLFISLLTFASVYSQTTGTDGLTALPPISGIAPTNGTLPISGAAPINGTAPLSGAAPIGTAPLSGAAPSGAPSGSGSTPDFMPRLDKPALTPSLAAISDSYIKTLTPILAFFPPSEQDIVAQCITSNTDTTRLVDPDCFKTLFANIKNNTAQGMSSELTNSSKTMRSSFGCLSKVTQTYADTTTDTASTTISTEMSSIVSQQTTLNNCAAAFIKSVQETLNTRRRFILTTKANIDSSLIKNSAGAIDGFIFSATEQTSIVASFKTYANCLNTFFSSMSTSVLSVQALIGQLGKCKPAPDTTVSSLLPAGTTVSSILPPGVNVSSLLPAGTTVSSLLPSGVTVSSLISSPISSLLPNGVMSALTNMTISSILPNGIPSGFLPSGTQPAAGTTVSSLLPSGATVSSILPSGTQPSGPQPSGQQPGFGFSSGNISFDAEGKPIFPTPNEFITEAQTIYTSLAAKTNVDWTTLANKLSATINQSSTGSFKNVAPVHNLVIDKLDNSQWIKAEFDKGVRQESCESDYVFYCTSGSCYCNDSNCPISVKGTTPVTIKAKPSVQIIPETTTTTTTPTTSGRLLQAPLSGTQPTGTTTGTQPTGTQPTGTQPTGTQPAGTTTGTQPSGTQPTGTQPAGTQPAGTQPSGTQPAGTQPTGTQPTGTQPAGTQSGAAPFGAPLNSTQSGAAPFGAPLNSTQSGAAPFGAPLNSTQSGAAPFGAPLNSTQSGAAPSGAQQSGSSFAPKVNYKTQTDALLTYYIAEACVSGKRFIYSEASLEMTGQIFDLVTKKPGEGMSQVVAQQFNTCGQALQTGTAEEKQNCRGPIQDDCANALDSTCTKTGLYDTLVNHPQTASPFPDDCNDSLATYTEQGCLSWISNNLMKATVIFDFRNFDKLPQLIASSIKTTSSSTSSALRYLQNSLVATDKTATDIKAQVNGVISDSDLTIDSATATKIPDANTYVTDLNTVTDTTTISSSFVKLGFGFVLTILLLLF